MIKGQLGKPQVGRLIGLVGVDPGVGFSEREDVGVCDLHEDFGALVRLNNGYLVVVLDDFRASGLDFVF